MILGVGIDLVDIARVKRLVAASGERAIRRLFTDDEASYAAGTRQPALHLAARVAAKEAAYKALAGTASARAIGWREMEVVRGDDGRPVLRLHGKAARRAAELGVRHVWLSLSHTATAAAAVVVLDGG